MAVVYFPWMHKELLAASPGCRICLLDPGLDQSGPGEDENLQFWQPEDLPLQGEKAQTCLRRIQELAEQYRDPEQLALQARQGSAPWFGQSSVSLEAELRQKLEPGQQAATGSGPDYALQAQMVLLLAWDLEQKSLEQDRLQQAVHDKWSRLQEALGTGDEQPDYFPGRGFLAQDPTRAMQLDESWPGLLTWFLYFLRPGDWLYVDQERIHAEWQERGLQPEPLHLEQKQELGLEAASGQWMKLAGPGRRLVLQGSKKQDKPWLEQEFQVLLAVG
ncbi:MAG: hypothetical protein ACLFRL_08715 [Desulfohalobiaceae bacterium]